jgi:tetrathionate reductase subunit B
MKKQLAMVIDSSKCWDCKGCQASCKQANKVPAGQWRNWIVSRDLDFGADRREPQLFQPGNCMHCDRPICVSACPTGATYKAESDGTVRIDRNLCIGCGQCIPACPYGARFRHAELKVADKCDFCAERRAAGLEPACVSTCPTKAREFGDLADPESPVAELVRENEVTRVVNPKSNTKPNIYYLGDPGQTTWPVEARMPLSFNVWKWIGNPAVGLVTGLSVLGVGAMLVKQILMPDDAPEEEGEEKGGGHE